MLPEPGPSSAPCRHPSESTSPPWATLARVGALERARHPLRQVELLAVVVRVLEEGPLDLGALLLQLLAYIAEDDFSGFTVKLLPV